MRLPPKKQPGQGLGARRICGAILDVRNGADHLGVKEKALRGLVARRLIPFRKLGGRIVFLRSELDLYLNRLPGVPLDEAMNNLEARR